MIVKITDTKHPYFNQELEAERIWNDTSSSNNDQDLYQIHTPTGEMFVLGKHLDFTMEEQKKLSDVIQNLGANVGDTVMVMEPFYGLFEYEFSPEVPHIITKIKPDGHIEFDHGRAILWNVKVRKVN